MHQISKESSKTCPNCAESIQAGAIYCRFCQRGLSSSEFEKCLYCAEMIRKKAIRCRFCKMDLFGKGEPSSEQRDPPSAGPDDGRPTPKIPMKPRRSANISLPLPHKEEET